MYSNQGFSVCDLDPGLSHTPLRHLYVLNRVFLRHFSLFACQRCQIITAREAGGDGIILCLSFVPGQFVLAV